jgi:hypothetical protein
MPKGQLVPADGWSLKTETARREGLGVESDRNGIEGVGADHIGHGRSVAGDVSPATGEVHWFHAEGDERSLLGAGTFFEGVALHVVIIRGCGRRVVVDFFTKALRGKAKSGPNSRIGHKMRVLKRLKAVACEVPADGRRTVFRRANPVKALQLPLEQGGILNSTYLLLTIRKNFKKFFQAFVSTMTQATALW